MCSKLQGEKNHVLSATTYNYTKSIFILYEIQKNNRSEQSNYQYRKTKQSQICSLKIRKCKTVGLQVIRISRVNGALVNIFLKHFKTSKHK